MLQNYGVLQEEDWSIAVWWTGDGVLCLRSSPISLLMILIFSCIKRLVRSWIFIASLVLSSMSSRREKSPWVIGADGLTWSLTLVAGVGAFGGARVEVPTSPSDGSELGNQVGSELRGLFGSELGSQVGSVQCELLRSVQIGGVHCFRFSYPDRSSPLECGSDFLLQSVPLPSSAHETLSQPHFADLHQLRSLDWFELPCLFLWP